MCERLESERWLNVCDRIFPFPLSKTFPFVTKPRTHFTRLLSVCSAQSKNPLLTTNQLYWDTYSPTKFCQSILNAGRDLRERIQFEENHSVHLRRNPSVFVCGGHSVTEKEMALCISCIHYQIDKFFSVSTGNALKQGVQSIIYENILYLLSG